MKQEKPIFLTKLDSQISCKKISAGPLLNQDSHIFGKAISRLSPHPPFICVIVAYEVTLNGT